MNMRTVILSTAVCFALAGCGGPETSQANNAQANISSENRTEKAANGMVLLAIPKAKLLETMHERHEGMEAVGKANKAIRRELDAGSPDLAVLRKSASDLNQLAAKASGWFVPGSGPELGKTGAKPEIWANPKDFAAKLRNFQAATASFNAAAKAGDVNAIKARFSDLGGTCKACHDTYRAEMKH